jgi:hypothetical protein
VDYAEELDYDEELGFVEGKAVTSISVKNRIESHRYQTSKRGRRYVKLKQGSG